ncbi:UNKNOWN [Stylonychia lemnae]|uniref:Ankyrin repeat-containing protein n=1 Tax=Stylonychia lemnae TaxID=5949 RepID=A0A077ZUD9_STYLE|nr:UNKNOWN [Stylonychia lemnae]|eukprot:CDW73189.1 UNKNOWN [Stylonychia lemnae]
MRQINVDDKLIKQIKVLKPFNYFRVLGQKLVEDIAVQHLIFSFYVNKFSKAQLLEILREDITLKHTYEHKFQDNLFSQQNIFVNDKSICYQKYQNDDQISQEFIDDSIVKILEIYSIYFDLSSLMNINVQDEFTLVHLAIKSGLYKCAFYFIDKLKFEIDFYRPQAKLTLLHVVAKHRINPFSEYEQEMLIRLMQRSNNLLLTNNFGKTVIKLARLQNCKQNHEFLEKEMSTAIIQKIFGMSFLMDKLMQRKKAKLNKYIIREIFKYIDG